MFRDILKKTGTYSIALFAGRAIGFLLLPLYTRFLTPADYGVLELLDLTVSILGILVGTRLGQTLFYHYFAATSQEEREKFTSTSLLGAALLGCAVAAASLPLSDPLSRLVFGTSIYGSYLRLMFLSFAFTLPVEVAYSYMRIVGNSAAYMRANLASLITAGVMNVVFLTLLHLGIRSVLFSTLLGNAGMALILIWYTLKPIRVTLDGNLFFRFLGYSMPLGFSGLAVFVIHYGDRAILRPYISLADLGIYSLAYKLGMLITFLYAPFALHWNANVGAIVKHEDSDRVYIRTCTYLTAGLSFAVVLITLFAHPLVRLMTTPDFYGAALFAPWVAAVYFLRALGSHLQAIFTAAGRPGLEAKVNGVGGAACLAAYLILIPRFKILGAIIATALGFFVILVYSFIEAQKIRPFRFEYGRLMRVILFAIPICIANRLVEPPSFLLQIGLATLLSGVYGLWIFFACFDREERNSAIDLVRGLLKKVAPAAATESAAV